MFPCRTRLSEQPLLAGLKHLNRLDQVLAVESHLRTIGVRQFRARWHEIDGDTMVRIEVGADEIAVLAEPGLRAGIVDVCRAEGFRWVTLDMTGYGE